jgi:hypothetical protein
MPSATAGRSGGAQLTIDLCDRSSECEPWLNAPLPLRFQDSPRLFLDRQFRVRDVFHGCLMAASAAFLEFVGDVRIRADRRSAPGMQ